MALFSRKKKESPAPAAPLKAAPKEDKKVEKKAATAARAPANLSVRKRAVDGVLLGPRITEKATDGTARGCYVFDIRRDAGKRDVKEAIIARYGVTPRLVRTSPVMPKSVTTRGSRKAGVKRGGKKAYVYLNAGDKIELA